MRYPQPWRPYRGTITAPGGPSPTLPSATRAHFRIFGIPIRVEPFFVVVAALFGIRLEPLWVVFAWVVIVFVSILMTPPSPDREGNIERGLKVFRTIGSPGFPFDEERIRNFAGRSFDRGFHPEGVARQICAIFASGNRKPLLANVRCPTLVLHGKEDVLVRFEGGVDTAGAIPGAKLVAIDGMGHDLPKGGWPIIIDGICEVAARG